MCTVSQLESYSKLEPACNISRAGRLVLRRRPLFVALFY